MRRNELALAQVFLERFAISRLPADMKAEFPSLFYRCQRTRTSSRLCGGLRWITDKVP